MALSNLGAALALLGNINEAIETFDKGLEIAVRTGDLSWEAKALYNKAVALDGIGRRDEAIPLAKDALEIFTRIEESLIVSKVKEKLEEWGVE